nr:hypothetical protein [Phyllobacterium phragmitis]
MHVSILPVGELKGLASVPSSKPHMQRALIFALLSEGDTEILFPSWSSETKRLFEAAKQFGLQVIEDGPERLVVRGTGGLLKPSAKALMADGSAFMFRTVAALASAVPGETTIEGYKSIKNRPVLQHLTFINDLGGNWKDLSDLNSARILINGKKDFGGATIVDTAKTSQFLTALLLIAPLSPKGVSIITSGGLVGEGYVDLTLSMMKERGIPVALDGNTYSVHPGLYKNIPITIPSDFTALSYLMAAVVARPGSELTVEHYRRSTMSSETQFFEAFAKLGAVSDYDERAHRLHIRHTNPAEHEIEIDAKNIPTVVPSLCAAACLSAADVTIRGAGHVNHHKCQRLLVMVEELRRLGCNVRPKFNHEGTMEGLIALGKSEPTGGVTLDSFRDHRVLGGLFAASLSAKEITRITGAEYMDAGFPSFFDVMSILNVRTRNEEIDEGVIQRTSPRRAEDYYETA